MKKLSLHLFLLSVLGGLSSSDVWAGWGKERKKILARVHKEVDRTMGEGFVKKLEIEGRIALGRLDRRSPAPEMPPTQASGATGGGLSVTAGYPPYEKLLDYYITHKPSDATPSLSVVAGYPPENELLQFYVTHNATTAASSSVNGDARASEFPTQASSLSFDSLSLNASSPPNGSNEEDQGRSHGDKKQETIYNID